jgi:hypothetical protein
MQRLALGMAVALGWLGLSSGGCVIEEREFDQHLANCRAYCDEIQTQCNDDRHKAYDRPEACMAVCQLMDPGETLGGSNGNTLRCRLDRLRAPDFEAATNCPEVGPGGNGACGTDCSALCKLRQQVCSEVQPEQFDITDPAACERSCQGLADGSSFSAATDNKGDTLQCRLVHISEAAISPELAEQHCWHTQTVPRDGETSPCSDPQELPHEADCATYCGLAMSACQGEYQVYADEAECLRVCELMDQGMRGAMSGNNVRCRRYHSYAALGDAAEHCTHAGPTGDGHCGENCASYCRILKQSCATEFGTRYGASAAADDLGSCESECSLLEGARFDGFRDIPPRYSVASPPQGPSLKCMTFHAVKALGSVDDPTECAAAFANPGSECQ